MFNKRSFLLLAPALAASHMGAAQSTQAHHAPLNPSRMPAVGTVDERFQSYNLEMIEVMGGKWWAPYGQSASAATDGSAHLSTDSAALRYQPPIDLASSQLRKLAAALSPAYVRVSDTWANTMYFQDNDAKVSSPPPPGFGAVLTGPQWRGVIDFSNAVNAPIVTTFSIGTGTRDAAGVWTPVEARMVLQYTKDAGGTIAAAEFFNEPNLAELGGAPKGYDAEAYGRDFKIFRDFVKTNDPEMKILGPGPIGEGKTLGQMPAGLKTADMLRAEGPGLDAFSYHFYGAVSERCVSLGPSLQTTANAALSGKWFSATDAEADYYAGLRDQYEPGKPLWLSETADAACGGNPWASTFLDTFRYLNQLGSLARRGVQVVMHNTLTGSDYGLLDRDTSLPRPNYWAALLWHRLMGTTVLDPSIPSKPNLYVYAHCLKGESGGVALLAINADTSREQQLSLPIGASRYSLTAISLWDTTVQLNGTALSLSDAGNLPPLIGEPTAPGSAALAPASITFFAMPNAANAACR